MKGIFLGPVGSAQQWVENGLQMIERWINTLTEFRGATSARDGADGLVPQPKKGDELKFLCGDGTFKTVSGSGGGGSTTFLGLTDTPDAYTGAAGKNVSVKSDMTGLEFTTAAGGGNVSAVPTPVNNQIAVWTDGTHIEGSPRITYDGTTFTIETLTNFQSSLQLLNTNDGNFGPMFDCYHNSATPAAADTIGAITWWANDSALVKQAYVSFQAKIDSPTAGARGGSFSVSTLKNNVAIVSMVVTNDGVTVGTDDAYGPSWDGSLMLPTKNAVYDKIQTLGGGGGGGNVSNVGTPVNNQLAIWTDATHIEGSPNLTFDGTTFTVTGGQTFNGTQFVFGGQQINVTSGVAQSIRSTDAGDIGAVQEFYHNSPSPAAGDAVALSTYYGNDSTSAVTAYAMVQVRIADATNGSEDGDYRIFVMKAGTLTNMSVLDGSGLTIFGQVFVTDEAYGPTWNGSLAVPTKNAVYDKIQSMPVGDVVGPASATDNALARFNSTTGKLIKNSTATLTDAGLMTTANVVVNDEAYAGTWDGSLQVPTKNAVYDKIQTLSAGGGGNVSNSGTPVDNQVAIWTTSTNIEGDVALTFNTATDTLTTGIVVVTDDAYGAGWDGSAAVPTKNAVYDKIQTLGAGGGGNVSNTGTPVDNQVAIWTDATHVEGDAALTFNTATDTLTSGIVVVNDEAYGGTWDGSTAVPTKNAVYDKIQSLSGGGAANYQAFTASGTWTDPGSGSMVHIQAWGGGGSGANRATSGNSGGGGGGEYIEVWLPKSAFTGNKTITVAAVVAGLAASTNGPGVVGNSTTVQGGRGGGVDLIAAGGFGGGHAAAGTAAAGGDGGDISGLGAPICGTNGALRNGLYSGAGGNVAASNVSTVGGNSRYGGGGGGGICDATVRAGGVSLFGGDGGASLTGVGTAGSGVAPSGGGGAARNGSASGGGARGEVRITVHA